MNRVTHCVAVLALLALPAVSLAQATAANSTDPSISGVTAVNTAAELLKAQNNPDAAISYFNDVLNQSRNAAVQRAIRFQLFDLYKQAGRADKALEVLKDLMVSIPPVAPPSQVLLIPSDGANAAPQQ